VRGRERRQRRKEIEAGLTVLPVTVENLELLFAAHHKSGDDEGFARARDSVRRTVRQWYLDAAGSPAAEDPQVRVLLDDLDPGWRAACGVAPGPGVFDPDQPGLWR
jgi:hypothetical protein